MWRVMWQVATRIPKARRALALGASFSGFHSGGLQDFVVGF